MTTPPLTLCAVVQLPVPPALLEISSLNRLMSIASRIVGRGLSHESQEAAHARWKEWQSASNALGLQQQHLSVALSAQSKALMIFMHMAARYGSGRVAFKVSAHRAQHTGRHPPLCSTYPLGCLGETALYACPSVPAIMHAMSSAHLETCLRGCFCSSSTLHTPEEC